MHYCFHYSQGHNLALINVLIYIIKFNMKYKPCARWSAKHRSSSLCINITFTTLEIVNGDCVLIPHRILQCWLERSCEHYTFILVLQILVFNSWFCSIPSFSSQSILKMFVLDTKCYLGMYLNSLCVSQSLQKA